MPRTSRRQQQSALRARSGLAASRAVEASRSESACTRHRRPDEQHQQNDQSDHERPGEGTGGWPDSSGWRLALRQKDLQQWEKVFGAEVATVAPLRQPLVKIRIGRDPPLELLAILWRAPSLCHSARHLARRRPNIFPEAKSRVTHSAPLWKILAFSHFRTHRNTPADSSRSYVRLVLPTLYIAF